MCEWSSHFWSVPKWLDFSPSAAHVTYTWARYLAMSVIRVKDWQVKKPVSHQKGVFLGGVDPLYSALQNLCTIKGS